MAFNIVALIFQLAASAFTVRMSTHPPEEGTSKEPHFWLYFSIAALGMLATCASIWSNNESTKKASDKISAIQSELAAARRPNLTPERLSMIQYPGHTVGVAMEVDNRGGGIAYNSHIFTIVSDVAAAELHPDLSYNENEARGRSLIPPESAMALRLDSGIPSDRLTKFLNRGDHIYFLGSLWWEDEHGVKQERAFCFQYRSDGWFESRRPRTCEA